MTLPGHGTAAFLCSFRVADGVEIGEFIQSQRPNLLRAIRTLLGPRVRARVEAEDILQEVAIAALRSVDRFHGEDFADLRRWLLGIARNRIMMLARLEVPKTRPRSKTSLTVPPMDPYDLDCIKGPPKYDECTSQLEEVALAIRAIDELPGDQRLVVTLGAMLGVSRSTIAFLLDRSAEAVRFVQLRARRRLRDRLSGPQRTWAGAGREGDEEGAHVAVVPRASDWPLRRMLDTDMERSKGLPFPWSAFRTVALMIDPDSTDAALQRFRCILPRQRQAFVSAILEDKSVEECLAIGYGPPNMLRESLQAGLGALGFSFPPRTGDRVTPAHTCVKQSPGLFATPSPLPPTASLGAKREHL